MKKEQINLKNYAIKIAKTDKEIENIKLLDDLIFRGSRGITLKELHKVKKFGYIFILHDITTGNMTGEAQLLFHSIPEIPYDFKSPVAYCYGVGIHPDLQARGLGKLLIAKVWETAVSKGASEVRLSVKIENYSSLKLMFDQGFKIIEYRKNFHGPNKIVSPRFIMSKKKDNQKQQYTKTKFLPTAFQKPLSKEVQSQIGFLMSRGFYGVDVTRLGIKFAAKM